MQTPSLELMENHLRMLKSNDGQTVFIIAIKAMQELHEAKLLPEKMDHDFYQRVYHSVVSALLMHMAKAQEAKGEK